MAFQLLNRQAFDVKAYDAAYNLAFLGGGRDPATLTAFLPGVYMPGYGPPADYNCGLGLPPEGPISCVLGGNPDPLPFLVGLPIAPLPNEAGWKDTVIAYPGQITRFVVRFAPTTLPDTATRADGAAYDFNPNGGHGYVWHCHIIDHEDNEMMRPMSVEANPNYVLPPGVTQRFELPQLDPLNPLP